MAASGSIVMVRSRKSPNTTDTGWKPTKENSSVWPFSAEMEKLPSKSAEVPLLVPAILMLTPGIVCPSSEDTTTPE